jgi:hypothetical protein
MTPLRTRRSYDHRIREIICETGDPDLFPELKIPRSTIRSCDLGASQLQRAECGMSCDAARFGDLTQYHVGAE